MSGRLDKAARAVRRMAAPKAFCAGYQACNRNEIALAVVERIEISSSAIVG